jgi:hypothetical protein
MKGHVRFALLLAAGASAAFAQLQLFQLSGGNGQPVASLFNFGSIEASDSTAVSFRLQNSGNSAAAFGSLAVSGTGFMLVSSAPPASLAAQATFDFVVSFQPASAGSYSATLQAPGVSVLLTGTATPALTWQIIGPAGAQSLTGPLDFGTVTLGGSTTVRITALNQTAQSLLVPAIAVSGADFSISGVSPSGALLESLNSTTLSIAFTPSQTGIRSGNLTIGTHTFALTGTGQAPPMPKASMSLTMPLFTSAQQGTIAITLATPAPIAASGTLRISFSPAAGIISVVDPAICFSSNGILESFTVAAGDTHAYFGGQPSVTFGTGTTAGAITFILSFGGVTTQEILTIAPAAASLTAVTATRQSGSITIQATGFDNTQTAGKLTFTFYDAAGNPVSPGAITADETTGFASYFGASGLGGVFALTAIFPVTGNPSQVAAFDLEITNSVGTAKSARTSF